MGHRCRNQAFTLPEALLGAAILAFAVAAIMQVVVSGQMQTYNALHENRAVVLAEALMDEVLALPYFDPDGASSPGPEAGESDRGDFDNCDDFHGFEQQAGQISDAGGDLYPALFQVFSRAVTAAYEDVTVTGLADEPQSGLNVTVTVTDNRNRTWTITRFIPEPAP